MDGLEARAYGLWDSPITPKALAQGRRFGAVAADSDGRTFVWLEDRGDRGVLVASTLDDPAPRDLTDELSVRARVGYGGGDFTVAHGWVVFVSGARLYRQRLSAGAPEPITRPLGAVASPAISPDGRWVLFVQSDEGDDCIAVVPLDGAQWPVKAAVGHDFFMQPRWHPAGDRIAWIAWDHPNMPWDGTELWTARFDGSDSLPYLSQEERIAGDTEVAIFQPEFTQDGEHIAYISDATGWGQLYVQSLASGDRRQITRGDLEYGQPAWNQGMVSYALVDRSRAVVTRSDGGFQRLQVVDLTGGEPRDLDALRGWSRIEALAPAPGGDAMLVAASGPARPPRVQRLRLDPAGSVTPRTLARATSETVAPSELAMVDPVSWASFDGETAHGLLYLPPSGRFTSPGKPPLIVLVHGGPTSQTRAGYDAQAQFLATRGYAVLLVNYRGSTGYGRPYMLKLRRSWGVYDVEDSRTACLALAERGLVDPERRVIMGGSAGGYTVLQSLVSHPGFYTAGVCLFGVSNQFALAADTHKFEARYTDSLLGPLPEAAPLYRERSPLFHAGRISDPIAVFQGDIDQVVPRAQSDEIVASLRARGVPHEYHVYEGEGHGWRKSETIERFYTALDRFLRQYVVFS